MKDTKAVAESAERNAKQFSLACSNFVTALIMFMVSAVAGLCLYFIGKDERLMFILALIPMLATVLSMIMFSLAHTGKRILTVSLVFSAVAFVALVAGFSIGGRIWKAGFALAYVAEAIAIAATAISLRTEVSEICKEKKSDRKLIISLVVFFAVIFAYQGLNSFNLVWAYQKGYDIWQSVFLDGDRVEGIDYSEIEQITDRSIGKRKYSGQQMFTTYEQLKKYYDDKCAQGAGTIEAVISVRRDNIGYVGAEPAYTYAVAQDIEEAQEDLAESYEMYPDITVSIGSYQVRLDDGVIIPVVISDVMVDRMLDEGSEYITFPVGALRSAEAAEMYTLAFHYSGDRYMSSDLWVDCAEPVLGWSGIVETYCTRTYAFWRSVIFYGLLLIAVAFYTYYGLKGKEYYIFS